MGKKHKKSFFSKIEDEANEAAMELSSDMLDTFTRFVVKKCTESLVRRGKSLDTNELDA